MIREIKALRESCAGIIAKIDSMLPQLEEFAADCGKGIPLNVIGRCKAISQHAIDRFRERTGSKKSEETICARVEDRLITAHEMELKPKYRVIELLAHGTPARYFKSQELLFVVENEMIVTVHKAEADRWIPKNE